jgi:hypothetical protein
MYRVRRVAALVVIGCAAWQGVDAQEPNMPFASKTQDAASHPPTQFPDLPLRRDAEATGAGGWTLPLVVVLGLGAFGAALIWRARTNRLSGAQPKARMMAVDALRLTPQTTLHVVTWQGEQFLIASTSQSATLLARKPAAEAEGGVSS